MLPGTMPATRPENELRMSLAAAAHLLQVSERTLLRWVDTLDVPCANENARMTFSRPELLDWANRHSMRLTADVPTDEDQEGALPQLSAAIARGGIHRGITGASVDEALAAASAAMDLPEEIDRDFFHQVLLAREDLDSTGIGEGFAVPHVRAPLVMHVEEAHVGIAFLDRPVDWHAVDHKPVDTLFVLVCPGLRSHLHLLRRIAQALHDETLRKLLLERAEDEALMARFRELEG